MFNQKLLSIFLTLSLFPTFLTAPTSAQNLASPTNQKIYLVQANLETDLETLFSQAQELQQQGQYQEAEQKYQQIKQTLIEEKGEKAPELAYVYFAIGTLDHQQQKYSEAKLHYETALTIDPQFLPVINNLGLIAYEQDQVDRAIEYFQSVLDIDRTVTESKLALAVALYKQGDKNSAIDLALSSFKENSQYTSIDFL